MSGMARRLDRQCSSVRSADRRSAIRVSAHRQAPGCRILAIRFWETSFPRQKKSMSRVSPERQNAGVLWRGKRCVPPLISRPWSMRQLHFILARLINSAPSRETMIRRLFSSSVKMSRCRSPRSSSQCENFIAAHGNKPRVCLALRTRSTPMAIAAVR
jgi:hypothetical protein